MNSHWFPIWIPLFAIVAASAALAQVAEPAPPPPEVSSPAPAAPAPESPVEAMGEYVVQAGDTLASIAQRLTGSEDNWVDLARENGIEDPAKLRVGQRLKIPAELKST